MPDPAYQVSRRVARQLAQDQALVVPFDIERAAARHATVLEDEIPGTADVIVLHADVAGDLPRIVVDASLRAFPERRRFAIAHALAHVLLGWHPLGSPCDVSTQPHELPVTAHDLVEGEANAFARELLAPDQWIASFDALERPAALIRHVAERAGLALMPSARAVAMLLQPGMVWAITDRWGRVLDAGRSQSTSIRPPAIGSQPDDHAYARYAIERHRDTHDSCTIDVWRFDVDAAPQLPHDRTARDVAADIATQLQLDPAESAQLAARVDGIAGWANEQPGVASIDGMRRALATRSRLIPELATVVSHPQFDALISAKATELVAKRLAR